VLAALPSPDVKLDAAFPRLTYTHRAWRDGDMYYFFNESDRPETRVATITGHGKAQAWDLGTGEIHPLADATYESDAARIPLAFGPYEAKVIVVGPLPKGVAAPEPVLASRKVVQELDGDWSLDLNGKQLTTALKSWEELGASSFAGPATYHKQFTAAKAPKGRHVYLEIDRVNDYARVTLNGKELGACSWQPYRWDVTSALKAGANDLAIEVDTTLTRQSPFTAPPPVPAPAGGRRAQAAASGAPAAPLGGTDRGGVASHTASGLLGPVRIVSSE
jgi:hypothetical protein